MILGIYSYLCACHVKVIDERAAKPLLDPASVNPLEISRARTILYMELSLQCIEAELHLFREKFEQSLRTNVPLADNVIRYFLDRRGKQLRPIMTLLSAKMLRGEVSASTINGAVAVELLHNASLMHDDVIDASDERRGKETINRVWDNHVAVLMGDFFLAKCLSCSSDTGSLEIIRALTRMTMALTEGELSQMSNARSHMLSEEAYFSVIEGKTASLFAACLQIGALSVNASADEVAQMGEIGKKFGLIFQIRDDIFDYFPTNDSVGKPTGHDILEGKVTLPLLYALQHGPSDEAQRMRDVLFSSSVLSNEDALALVEFARQVGGIEYAQACMKKISFDVKQQLSCFPANECRAALMSLVDYIIDRKG